MNSKIDEYVTYLGAWCKTNKGVYEPYDTKGIYDILVDIVKNGDETPIKTFKERFSKGEIKLPIFCMCLTDWYKKERFDVCMNIVKEFEEKHSMKQ